MVERYSDWPEDGEEWRTGCSDWLEDGGEWRAGCSDWPEDGEGQGTVIGRRLVERYSDWPEDGGEWRAGCSDWLEDAGGGRELSIHEDEPIVFATNSLQRRKKVLPGLRPSQQKSKQQLIIGLPQDFRQISSIIDVDILPETHRRVRLHKHGTNKPLGFYIRDGVSVRVAPQGVEKVPGVFISRLVRGGLAESTGLLAVNDEILEVNGINVAGKSLDQVTDMMVANSHNLIVTVKPANQRNNVMHRGSKTSAGARLGRLRELRPLARLRPQPHLPDHQPIQQQQQRGRGRQRRRRGPHHRE
ncbi:hypothetical protein ACEWY4_011427 [Coilia grayii]|uniref:PDZ domain-containing protein n=1 Tax=Coilia grayii TaxID=363190 RepID=A0ABD1K4Q1_9TELE